MPYSRGSKKKNGKTSRDEDSGGNDGRYRKKEPSSPSVAARYPDYYRVRVVRQPSTPRWSDRSLHPQATPGAGSKNARSLSVPSLHATDVKTKLSPPLSPQQKPRSKSVRLNAARKALSFKRIKKFLGSHSELDSAGGGWGGPWDNEPQSVGRFRSLNEHRPRSIGGSSDCSNSSFTHSDFCRCNSLRDSSRSRISHNDSVFGPRGTSYDSEDYSSIGGHLPPVPGSASTSESNLRPFSIAYLPRSSSSNSLKTYAVQAKLSGDTRHHSIATVPGNHIEPDDRAPIHRGKPVGRHAPPTSHRATPKDTDSESLWEDSQSFDFVNAPVLPSDPEYRQIAEELMTCSPTHKTSVDSQGDIRRMSDASVDPRRVSISSTEMLSTKPPRSLPSTPVAASFSSVRNGSGTSPDSDRPATPQEYLPQEGAQSLPPGWDMAVTQQGVQYYLDHNTQTSHWRLPGDTDETSLPLPSGWEVINSKRYGTYYVNHLSKSALYQHPYHSRPPPPYHRPPRLEEEEGRISSNVRRTPARSHSHRGSQAYRVLEPNASLPRRSQSFRDVEDQDVVENSHTRQLSTITYVPPSPYQIAEIPPWLKDYVEAPFGCKTDTEIQWLRYSQEDLNGLDTMIKRLLRKSAEQIVKQCEYHRVAIQQEIDTQLRQQKRQARDHTHRDHAHQPPATADIHYTDSPVPRQTNDLAQPPQRYSSPRQRNGDVGGVHFTAPSSPRDGQPLYNNPHRTTVDQSLRHYEEPRPLSEFPKTHYNSAPHVKELAHAHYTEVANPGSLVPGPYPDTGSRGHPGLDASSRGHTGLDAGSRGHPGLDAGSRGHPGLDASSRGHTGLDDGSRGHTGLDAGSRGHPGLDTGSRGHTGLDAGSRGHPGLDAGSRGHTGLDTGSRGHTGHGMHVVVSAPNMHTLATHVTSSIVGEGEGGVHLPPPPPPHLSTAGQPHYHTTALMYTDANSHHLHGFPPPSHVLPSHSLLSHTPPPPLGHAANAYGHFAETRNNTLPLQFPQSAFQDLEETFV